MILITCVDNNNGMLFNNRRVSRDRKVIEDIGKFVGDCEILITAFSEELFIEDENVRAINVIEKQEGKIDSIFKLNIKIESVLRNFVLEQINTQ